MTPQNAPDEEAPTLTPVEARQGRSGRPIVWVLLISVALVVLGFAVVWALHAPGFSGAGGQTQVSGKGTNTPVGTPLQDDPSGTAKRTNN